MKLPATIAVAEDFKNVDVIAIRLSGSIYEGRALSTIVELASMSKPLMPMNKFGSLNVSFSLSGI
jgi:hypothetical protein